MSYLSLQHLRKTWGSKVALDDISFTVAEGEFVALLGPSGCGKSTLLRTLAGLEQADSGSIQLQQRDISQLSPAQRQLSMVFQSYALFPHLNVRENLLFGLRARGEDARQFPARLAEVSQLMGLESLLDRLPSQLSGGQQQRVALGRAVIARHRLCLMDEPLSNLDAKLRQSMRREIRALQKQLGLTLIYVTHDQTEAMSMADQIILLNDGRIEQQGTPAQLYNDPASVFAAQFIGAPPMNIVPLLRQDDRHYLGEMPLPVVQHGGGEQLSLGLRAEAIQLIASERAALSGDVLSVEYMGADTLVVVQIAAASQPLTVKMPGLQHFASGSRVGLQWPAAAQTFFSTHHGHRCTPAEHRILPPQTRMAV